MVQASFFAELGGEKIAACTILLSRGTPCMVDTGGAKVDIDFLHFETCYYQGIDLANSRKK